MLAPDRGHGSSRPTCRANECFLHKVLGCISIVAEQPSEPDERCSFLFEYFRHERVRVDTNDRRKRSLSRHVVCSLDTRLSVAHLAELRSTRTDNVVIELSIESEDPADHRQGQDIQAMKQPHQQQHRTDSDD